MYAIAMTGITMHIHIFIPILTRTYCDQLEAVLHYINNDFNFERVPVEFLTRTKRRQYDTLVQGIKWFVGLVLLYLPFASCGFIYAITFCDESCLSDPQMYTYVIPYLDRVHSYSWYISFQMFIIPLTTVVFINGCTVVLFPLMIGFEFHNEYLNLCCHLHQIIDKTISRVRTTPVELVTTNSRQRVIMKIYNKTTDDSNIFQEFKKELANVVKQHRTLTRYVKEYFNKTYE